MWCCHYLYHDLSSLRLKRRSIEHRKAGRSASIEFRPFSGPPPIVINTVRMEMCLLRWPIYTLNLFSLVFFFFAHRFDYIYLFGKCYVIPATDCIDDCGRTAYQPSSKTLGLGFHAYTDGQVVLNANALGRGHSPPLV